MSKVTKLALRDALHRVMARKPYNKITISDITTECGVNRMTFYYPFKDLNDLMEWWLRDAILSAAGENFSADNWEETVLTLFDRAYDGRDFLLRMYDSIDLMFLHRVLESSAQELCMRVLREHMQRLPIHEQLPERDAQLLAEVFSYVLLGVFFNWLENGMKEDPSYLVNRCSLLLHDSLPIALTKLNESNTRR